MNDLKLLTKYKNQFLASVFALAGMLLIWQVIVPNVQAIFDQQAKNDEQRVVLQELNASAQLIETTDQATLQKDLSVVTHALPPSKDIPAIYSAITSAVVSSGAFFEGFSVSPGGIYSLEKDDGNTPGVPSLPVTIKLSNVSKISLAEFLSSLSRTVPLSSVTSIDLGNNTAQIQTNFFYKPYNLGIINTDRVSAYSSSEQELLQTLSTYN